MSGPVPIRLIVADDQAAIREALGVMLDLTPGLSVVATASDGAEAVRAVAEYLPDVILMDLNMPVLDGVAATRQIMAEHPGVAILVLTTFADDASILGALAAGARGYLTKEAGRADIARAITAAAAGQSVLDPAVQARLVAAATGTPTASTRQPAPVDRESPDGLTSREVEVLRRIAAGRSNREVARELFISEATVKSHVNNLFAKTGVRDRAQAVRYAFDHGLAD